ncbi:MAG: hypothetical protein ACYDHH_30875, partial [Solirubrobacteraceae bacterium]
LARGFTLADFALLCAIWAMTRIVSDGAGEEPPARRWLVLYAVAAVVAVYSEYDASATLIPLALAVAYLVPGRKRVRAPLLALVPLLAHAPWAHQLSRSLNLVHVTKAGGFYLNVAPGTVRDQLVPLVYGQTGQHLSALGRTAALLAAVGVVAAGLRLMATGSAAAVVAGARARGRATTVLVAACLVGTLLLHMLAPAVGIGIFNQRYLTAVIPLACVPFAYLLTRIPWRRATPAAAIALAAFGCGLAIKRLHNDTEPDPALIRAAVAKYHPGTILTNSAVIDYYLRDLHPLLDRPLGFGVGRQHDCGGCRKPVVIVDDAKEGAGARRGAGPGITVGHYEIQLGFQYRAARPGGGAG